MFSQIIENILDSSTCLSWDDESKIKALSDAYALLHKIEENDIQMGEDGNDIFQRMVYNY